MSIVLTIYLLVISVFDIMRKSISFGLLMVGGILGLAVGVVRVYRMNISWNMLLASILPGIIFLLISFLSHMMGYGDGIVLCGVGGVIGFRKCLALMGISLFLMALFCIALLLMKRVTKTTRIPYIPFLLIAFLILGG